MGANLNIVYGRRVLGKRNQIGKQMGEKCTGNITLRKSDRGTGKIRIKSGRNSPDM